MTIPADQSPVYVMLKWSERRHASPDDVVVHGVFHDLDAVMAKIERIRKANKQYPMTECGPMNWRIGPDYDEGFFGNSPVRIKVVTK